MLGGDAGGSLENTGSLITGCGGEVTMAITSLGGETVGHPEAP